MELERLLAVFDAAAANLIEEYRYRLKPARRRAVRTRIEVLVSEVDRLLPLAVLDVARDSGDRLKRPETVLIRGHIAEIDRLLADTSTRAGRWTDLYRHMSFSEGHDWWDIVEFDWPSVKPEILSAAIAESIPCQYPPSTLALPPAASRAAG